MLVGTCLQLRGKRLAGDMLATSRNRFVNTDSSSAEGLKILKGTLGSNGAT